MTRITRRDLIKSVAAVGIGVGVTGLPQIFAEGKQERTQGETRVTPGIRPIAEGTADMTLYSVKAITATVGGPSTFALSSDNNTDLFLSSSPVVLRVLLDAFFIGARVEVDLVKGSNVVQRVHPIDAAKVLVPLPSNEYRVTRLATQRMPNGQGEHLEAFLLKKQGQDIKGPAQDKAYNVYDQLLQLVLEAAFSLAPTPQVYPLHVEFNPDENNPDGIVMLRLGTKVDCSVTKA
jgi:hypothetical protein